MTRILYIFLAITAAVLLIVAGAKTLDGPSQAIHPILSVPKIGLGLGVAACVDALLIFLGCMAAIYALRRLETLVFVHIVLVSIVILALGLAAVAYQDGLDVIVSSRWNASDPALRMHLQTQMGCCGLLHPGDDGWECGNVTVTCYGPVRDAIHAQTTAWAATAFTVSATQVVAVCAFAYHRAVVETRDPGSGYKSV